MRHSTRKVGNGPGFCPIVLENIKRVSLKISPEEKFCFLSFDEISIKRRLYYNQYLDWVTGYEFFGSNNSHNNRLATNALEFMVRGLSKKWKQPIGYFFQAIVLLSIY